MQRAYGTLTAVFPGKLTAKLPDVAYVPEVAFISFTLMAAHEQGVRCATEEERLCISLFGERVGFEGGRSNFTLVLLAGLSQTVAVCHSPHPPEDCVESGCNFPLMFPFLA